MSTQEKKQRHKHLDNMYTYFIGHYAHRASVKLLEHADDICGMARD